MKRYHSRTPFYLYQFVGAAQIIWYLQHATGSFDDQSNALEVLVVVSVDHSFANKSACKTSTKSFFHFWEFQLVNDQCRAGGGGCKGAFASPLAMRDIKKSKVLPITPSFWNEKATKVPRKTRQFRLELKIMPVKPSVRSFPIVWKTTILKEIHATPGSSLGALENTLAQGKWQFCHCWRKQLTMFKWLCFFSNWYGDKFGTLLFVLANAVRSDYKLHYDAIDSLEPLHT